jgi:hypothetical protein
MNLLRKSLQAALFACLIPTVAFARGGTTAALSTANIVLLSATVQTCPVSMGCTAPIVAADQTITITIIVQSDGNDNPWIEQTAGPTLVPTMAFAAGRSPDARGSTIAVQYATWEWTPTKADIGTDASASFVISTKSGQTLNVDVPIGVVQDLQAPAVVTDFTAAQVGGNLTLRWTPPTDDHVTFYKLTACLPQDPSIGSPVCQDLDMPGVKTVTDPSGTETQAVIPAIADVGTFASPVVNFKITNTAYPSAPTPLAYIHLIASSGTSVAGAQDYVIRLSK